MGTRFPSLATPLHFRNQPRNEWSTLGSGHWVLIMVLSYSPSLGRDSIETEFLSSIHPPTDDSGSLHVEQNPWPIMELQEGKVPSVRGRAGRGHVHRRRLILSLSTSFHIKLKCRGQRSSVNPSNLPFVEKERRRRKHLLLFSLSSPGHNNFPSV